MNIQERVEQIIKPYVAQPAVNGVGINGIVTDNTYNTLRDNRTSYANIMYSIGTLYREEFKQNPELLDAVIERVQAEMNPADNKVANFTK